ncbi:MAG TPA: DUF3108 domain-containing protein [Usitatibacter sp.]|nr:DUF3108 domain-containing protein [Usitatibacter sp.]
MGRAGRTLSRYRLVALAVVVSAVLHAALFVGLPGPAEPIDTGRDTVLTARLEPLPPAPKPAPPKPVAKPRPPPPPQEAPPAPAPQVLASATPSSELPAVPPPSPEPPKNKVIAVAEPVIPWLAPRAQPSGETATFPMEGLPARLTIDYRLTSGPIEAHAAYHWVRDGDGYRITGDGEAQGIFRLFVQGAMVQESEGTVTSAGLRPERFVEQRPGHQEEGLEFDWLRHTVTFDRGPGNRKVVPLTDDTVDWLTMIFQLAHLPPREPGQTLTLRVFTQRKLYDFHLSVLGVEEIQIPMGRVRTLHLRHIDPDDGKPVDVWLGIDQHYLPVRLRYPVAKMGIMVEQSATRIAER